ncbi:MAG: hypothetical protein A2958_00080 [Candidatus Levybacteria bacterium RIFCSPLOWO2_01_FULL_38_13]|nr:MAG: hypothetical protein A2629_02165 [Candidatus Levybacteria bacterium RIFCSPHIGHO2_01_FULL_41_15]OGH34939.1 MAG: hypothetical protein A2958_00080 [Candidatus Levybacteria bacterium RIFCSPLOWO2_01_FULL_38_13]
MKIGMLLPSVYMGSKYKNKIFAPKQLFLSLVDGLVGRGHTVYVYAAPGTNTKAYLVEGHREFIEQDFISPKFRGLDRLTKLKNAHIATKTEYEIDLSMKAYIHGKEKKLDIMHSYHDFMAHYINRLADLPTVYTIHDPLPRREHLEYWRFKHFRNDNYIFISESQLKNFSGLVKSVGVIYHGVNTKKFSFGDGNQGYIAFIGRYIKEKGVVEAITASKEAGVTLRMVGDDAYRKLAFYQTKIKPHLNKGVIEDETFLGEADRGSFLRNAKALLFPILWEEPFGMVMIESMACGTPVVAYNHGSVSEIIKDGITGFIVDPDEGNNHKGKGSFIIKKTGIEGLVEAVKNIDKIDRSACRKHVEENFTVEKMVDGYERVYSQLINK